MTTRKFVMAIVLGWAAAVLGIAIAGFPGVLCVLVGEIIGWLSFFVGSND